MSVGQSAVKVGVSMVSVGQVSSVGRGLHSHRLVSSVGRCLHGDYMLVSSVGRCLHGDCQSAVWVGVSMVTRL